MTATVITQAVLAVAGIAAVIVVAVGIPLILRDAMKGLD